MIDFFKNVRWSLLLIGLLTIVIGGAMVLYPETESDIIVKILGGIMGVAAIFSILGYLIDRARGRTAFSNLFVGALMLIMGAVLYFKPETFVEFLRYIFAAIVLVQGLNLIIEALTSKKYQTSHWGQTFLMGLICIGFSVIVFINPFKEFKPLMILTGIALIIAGLLNVFVSGRIGLAVHRHNKAIKDAEPVLSEESNIVESIAEGEAKIENEALDVMDDTIKEDAFDVKEEIDTSSDSTNSKIPEKFGDVI